MSLCITVLTHDTIVIAADSAGSSNINGTMHRVHDDVEKLIILDKNTVAFISGDCDLSKLIMDDLSSTWDKSPTIEYVHKTVKFWSEKYYKIRPEAEFLRKRDKRLSNATVIAQFKNNCATLYTFDERTNFELQTYTVKQHQHMIQSHGIKTEEAGKAIAKQLDRNLSVYEAINNTYDAISCEEVGGTLEGYMLTRNGIKPFVRRMIPEKANLKRFDIDVYKNTEYYKQKILVHNAIKGSSLEIGQHDDVLKMFPNQGVWLGDENFTEAPFSVDLQGNMIARKAKLIGAAGEILFDTEIGKINIGAMDIEGVGKLEAQYIQTGTVTAEDGFINDLTVTALKTLDKSDQIGDSVDFITAKEKFIKFSTGTITDRTHAKNNNNELLYWTDASKKQITTNASAFPVYKLEYEPVDKMAIELIGEGMSSHPRITMGAGDGATETSGKSITEKIDGSYDTYYYSSNYGRERSLRLKDDEVLLKSENSKIHMQAKNYEIEAEDGAVKITLSNGSYFELTSSGDINAHAINNIKMTADAKVQFNANEYEFK